MVTLIDSRARAEAPAPKRPSTPAPEPVSVNGVEIARAAIAAEMQNHPAPSPAEAYEAAIEALVVRELLLQEAARLCLETEPLTDAAGRRETDEEALVRALIEREVTTPQADEANCRRYYQNNRKRFRSPDIVEASHILLPAAPEDEPTRRAAREAAVRILAELRADPEAFDRLARLHSACPSKEAGGNLGQLTPGSTVPEFESALADLPEGTLGDPVETRYGIHVVRVERRVCGQTLPFEAVRGRIAAYLEAASRHRAIHQYIGILAGRADIRGFEL